MSFTDYMFGKFRKKPAMPDPEDALPGRTEEIVIRSPHTVLRTPLMPPYPEGTHLATFAMGCFWGVEKLFWQLEGVYTTAVGYAGGFTPNPNYEEVCGGRTGHAEVVLVVYWPNQMRFEQLLQLFWSSHNPTEGMRQGNDRGTQYRSAIYWHNQEQRNLAETSLADYQAKLDVTSGEIITTEILEASEFYFGEEYHQQYLAKNPNGYCNMQTCAKTGLPEPEVFSL